MQDQGSIWFSLRSHRWAYKGQTKISAAKDKHKHACKHNCSLCLELQNSIFHMAGVLGHNKCQWRRIQRGEDAIC